MEDEGFEDTAMVSSKGLEQQIFAAAGTGKSTQAFSSTHLTLLLQHFFSRCAALRFFFLISSRSLFSTIFCI